MHFGKINFLMNTIWNIDLMLVSVMISMKYKTSKGKYFSSMTKFLEYLMYYVSIFERANSIDFFIKASKQTSIHFII